MIDFEDLKIAVLGGDRREEILVEALIERGAQVLLVGYHQVDGATNLELRTALERADAIVAPMSNTDNDGFIRAVPTGQKLRLSRENLRRAREGVPFLIGMAKPRVKMWVEEAGLNLVELGELDELAIPNAIPTAEGAVQLAMEKLPITIHSSRALVLGFGRCGSILAKLLQAMGAETTVAARRRSQLAMAKAWGLSTITLEGLGGLAQFDVIYNTIPALVLTEELLAQTKQQVLVIDLASAPGGVDFQAAEQLGREAILALGLPGKVAPLSAGRILSEVVPSLIWELVQ
jgi:dipicolinate synthase subunit A